MGKTEAMASRVAITGVGLVTPLGLSAAKSLERCRSGESAIGPIHNLEVDEYRCRAGAYVPEFDLNDLLRQPKNSKFMGHSVRCAMLAAREAIDHSGVDLGRLDPMRVALYIGSGQTGIEYDEYFPALEAAWGDDLEMDFKHVGGLPSHLIDRYIVLRTLANGGLGLLSNELGIKGSNGNIVQSDTASAQAISCAYHELVENRSDAALAGGHESLLNVSNFLAYEKAGLLSRSDPAEAYRPFDQRRDGLALGAGSGFLMLERWEDATARRAKIVGELCGFGCATVTNGDRRACNPETLRVAIAEAMSTVDTDHVDFVMARGIGTMDDDTSEAESIASVLGSHVPVTALKGQTGYLGAATAAVELILGLLHARQGCVPPIVRHTVADKGCALDLVVGKPRPLGRRPPLGLFLAGSWGGQTTAIAARAMEA